MFSQVLSLSIDETNKLRAKLGLKPLNVNKADAEETAEEKKQPGVLIPGDRFFTHTPCSHGSYILFFLINKIMA